MRLSRSICTVTSVIVVAAAVAQAAFAGGEPKNEWPFMRAVGTRTTQGMMPAKVAPAIRGEPKNEPPFTRPATIVVTSGGGGFDWTSGGIGAVAGIGAAVAGAGVVVATRRSPRTA